MSFFDGAWAMPEGLVVRGEPRATTATLVLGPAAVTVRAGKAEAVLPWEAHGWNLYHSVSTTNGGAAIVFGVSASGSADLATVRAALPSSRRGDTVHVFDTTSSTVTQVKELITLRTLCDVLRDDRASRERLADRERVARLIRDMQAQPLSTRGTKLHVSPRKAEIAGTMAALGFVHRFGGRPVPGVTKETTRDDAIAAVTESIRTSARHHGAVPSPREVGEMLDHDYFEIDPWPFAAVTQEQTLVTAPRPQSRLRRWFSATTRTLEGG